jgi:hypothetical protein
MMHSVFHWLRRDFAWRAARRQPAGASRTRHAGKPRRSYVPQLLVLEDRTVLSVLTVLNNADGGAGSLRAAIAAAQSGDTIVFDHSLANETITLSSGPLALSSNLTIHGLGANHLAISGKQASRLFTLSGSAQVTIADLTLTGGKSSQGGAILIGGTAALTPDSDILSGNQAVGDSNGNALGGAVYNSAGANLTIDNTAFVNNQTNGTNNSFGGAIANAGSLTITRATFTGNAALGSMTPDGPPPGGSLGGAVGDLDGARAAITLSTFTGNQALGSGTTGDALGGAICNQDGYLFPFTGSGITCTVAQCTFANNTAKADSTGDFIAGGAIEDQAGVNLAVLSCSFSGNEVNSGGAGAFADGGAIDNAPADTVTISDSQFLNNSAIGSGVQGNFAQAPGGAIATGGGTFNGNTVVLTLSNSIFAGNEAIGGSGGLRLDFLLPVADSEAEFS